MGFADSDGEDQLLTKSTGVGKSFKLPRKFFDECNTVDHASVPRKLRSAKRKHNRESISPLLPDKKKLNHGINGVEVPRKDRIKKLKLNMQDVDSGGSPSQITIGQISKDEEEVVETLNALAEMFPLPNNNKKNDSDCELANAKSSPSRPAFEAPEKEKNSESLFPSSNAEAANTSLSEGSAQETVQVTSSIEPSQSSFPNSAQSYVELDNTISQRNVQAISLFSKSEPTNSNVQSALSMGNCSKQSKHEEVIAYVVKPEIASEPATTASSQHELRHTLKENKNNGSALWPGLSSAGSYDAGSAGTRGPFFQTSTAKAPACLGMAEAAAAASQPNSLDNGVLTEKDSRASVARKKSWKRCSTHIYLSQFIKVFQIGDRKDGSPVQPIQLTPNEGSKQGVLIAANNLNRVPSGLDGAVSAYSLVGSAAEKNPNEVRNAILLHKRLVQDEQQASMTSVLHTTQKQSFDFLSLSTGSGGVKANASTNNVGNVMDPLTQFHSPYLQSLVQNQRVLPFSLPQNCFSSPPFTNNLPVAAAAKQVHIQPSPYPGSLLFGPPHLGISASPKQQQQQQQQQRIWAAQLAADYRTGGIAASHISNWQNGRQDHMTIPYPQSILPPSHSSLEVLGPRYAPMSQHQQQLIAVSTSSLPSSRAKRQHHHLPYGYEGNGVGSCPDTAMPLQLLCNEHL